MSEKQRPPDLNATDATIPAFKAQQQATPEPGGDLLWADFSDLSDEWTETILKTVNTPVLEPHGSTLETTRGGAGFFAIHSSVEQSTLSGRKSSS